MKRAYMKILKTEQEKSGECKKANELQKCYSARNNRSGKNQNTWTALGARRVREEWLFFKNVVPMAAQTCMHF